MAPLSNRAQEDHRQIKLIRKALTDSGKVYGYRNLHDDLYDQGEHGVVHYQASYRLMRPNRAVQTSQATSSYAGALVQIDKEIFMTRAVAL
jgi:hypothetical protein